MNFFKYIAILAFIVIKSNLLIAYDKYEFALKSAVTVITVANIDKKVIDYGGSGVIIDAKSEYVLTSRHLIYNRVKDAKIACILQSDKSLKSVIQPEDPKKFYISDECEIVFEDERYDLVLLKRIKKFQLDSKPVKLASKDPKIGELVFGVFSPSMVPRTFYQSYISTKLEQLNTLQLIGIPPRLILPYGFGYAAPVSQGASGSMVLNENGSLIGITMAVLLGTNTGIAVPREFILDFLKNYQAKNEKFEFTTD